MKLYYFDMPARGEPIRLLLHHAKVPFEDIRINPADWPKMKDTFEGKQLPVLEVDGKRYAQSYAILEYLGAKYGYLPMNPKDLYENTCVMNVVDDINEKFSNAFSPYSPYDAETKKKLQEEITKELPIFFNFLEKKLEAKPCKEFMVGCKYTVSDFYFMTMYIFLRTNEASLKVWNELQGIPLIKAYMEKKLKDFENYFKKPATKPKLYYFDAPMRGEMVRLVLRQAKVDFEDVRIKFQEWSGMKDKFSLKQVPVYEENGVQHPQTDAIMHMLCLRHGYLPLDADKMYRVLFITNTIKDFFEGFVRFFYGKLSKEAKEKAQAQYFGTTVPLVFSLLEKRIKENESKDFIIGSQYTMADFYILGAAKWLILGESTASQYAEALKNAPTFSAYLTKRIADFK